MESANETHRMQQVLVDLPNGITFSIITDGYGAENGFYEAMVSGPKGTPVQGLGLDESGIRGWLSPKDLGHMLSDAAKAELRTVYVLRED